jgi:hypothetical protein
MTKRFSQCILHIGTEKTGTTTIQNFLSANRKAIAQDGTLYTVCGGQFGSQRGFEACVHSRPWATDLAAYLKIHNAGDQAKFRSKFLADFQLEADAQPSCHNLLVSCEHFHSRLTTVEEIARLKELLLPWVEQFQVVMYLRRQDRVAVSHYSTRLKSGEVSPSVFPVLKNGHPFYYYDYETVYRHWAQVFGEAPMRVRIFEKDRLINGDLLQDWCATCNVQLADKKLPVNANESLTQAGIDFIRELNRQLPAVIAGNLNLVRSQLTSIVSRLCRGSSHVAARSEAVGFYQLYRPGNDRLKARILPTQPTPLFSEDFSDYPEHVQQSPPQYADAVRIVIGIWTSSLENTSKTGRHSELAAVSNELTAAKAQNAFLQGQLAVTNGNAKNARRLFLKALEFDPRHVRAHLSLARLLLPSPDNQAEGFAHLERARTLAKAPIPEIKQLYDKFRPQSIDRRNAENSSD